MRLRILFMYWIVMRVGSINGATPKKKSRNAYMAQLKNLSSEFQNGVDVFKVMASKVTGFVV